MTPPVSCLASICLAGAWSVVEQLELALLSLRQWASGFQKPVTLFKTEIVAQKNTFVFLDLEA